MNTKKVAADLSAIEDELIKDILAIPIAEIDDELTKHNSSLKASVEETKTFISEHVARTRKQLLPHARAAIEKNRQEGLLDQAINTAQQAQDFIFKVIASGTVQSNQLTSAFREGEDIPDEDLIAIANEIRDLVNSNEKTD